MKFVPFPISEKRDGMGRGDFLIFSFHFNFLVPTTRAGPQGLQWRSTWHENKKFILVLLSLKTLLCSPFMSQAFPTTQTEFRTLYQLMIITFDLKKKTCDNNLITLSLDHADKHHIKM